jgi:hypothetical protein
MKTKLADRVAALEAVIAKPRFRIVVCETVYADDDEADERRKVNAAIAADRKSSGWEGEYSVLIPISTHTKDGKQVSPHEISRLHPANSSGRSPKSLH